MSKKKRNPEAPAPANAALILARVERERAWAHARWMERMTYGQISALSALPVDLGGLGVHISHAGIRAMVAEYRESRGDVTMSRDERLERQSDELDEIMRALRAEIAEYVEREGSVPANAVKLLLEAGKREADLHGLAAATKIDATVTHRDGLIDELNASLAALGRPAVDVTP
jgi:hypothetical protein